MDVRHEFLHELKEDRILLVKWIPGPTTDADLHTKNLTGQGFNNFGTVYTGKDKYSSMSY